MASNGYVRRVCGDCIFFSDDREYGYRCSLCGEWFDSKVMGWVSGNDCDNFPEMKEKYYEQCEHYSSKREIKNQIREKFGFEKIDYSK